MKNLPPRFSSFCLFFPSLRLFLFFFLFLFVQFYFSFMSMVICFCAVFMRDMY
jgi:hypothetical protein